MRMPLFFINNTQYCAVFPILPSISNRLSDLISVFFYSASHSSKCSF